MCDSDQGTDNARTPLAFCFFFLLFNDLFLTHGPGSAFCYKLLCMVSQTHTKIIRKVEATTTHIRDAYRLAYVPRA